MILQIEVAVLTAQLIALAFTRHWIKSQVMTKQDIVITKRIIEHFRRSFDEADSRRKS